MKTNERDIQIVGMPAFPMVALSETCNLVHSVQRAGEPLNSLCSLTGS